MVAQVLSAIFVFASVSVFCAGSTWRAYGARRRRLSRARLVRWAQPKTGWLVGSGRFTAGSEAPEFGSGRLLSAWGEAHGVCVSVISRKRIWRSCRRAKWAVYAPPVDFLAAAMGPPGLRVARHDLEHHVRDWLLFLNRKGVRNIAMLPYLDPLAAHDLIDERQSASAAAVAGLNLHLEAIAAEFGAEVLDLSPLKGRSLEFTRSVEGSPHFNSLGHGVVAATVELWASGERLDAAAPLAAEVLYRLAVGINSEPGMSRAPDYSASS